MNQKQFTAKLNGVLKSAKNMRENVQTLIIAGLEHYQNHADTVYLSQLVNGIIGVKALPTRSITAYIQEHANVKWVAEKNKQKQVIRRYKKVSKDADVAVTMPEKPWYEHESNTSSNKVSEVNPANKAARTIADLNKAIEKGTCTDVAQARAMIKALEQFVPKSEAAQIAEKIEAKAAKQDAAVAVAKASKSAATAKTKAA